MFCSRGSLGLNRSLTGVRRGVYHALCYRVTPVLAGAEDDADWQGLGQQRLAGLHHFTAPETLGHNFRVCLNT